MSILEKNLSCIPELKEIFEKNKDKLYPVEKTKNDNITIKLNDIYLHSKYDPVKETERLADLLLKDKDELDAVILCGCGFGYIARLLYEKFITNNTSYKIPYIIYIEPDIRIFLTSLEYFDWTPLLKDEHFKIFLEAEKELIGSFIQSIPTKRIRYYNHRPTYAMHQDYYREIQKYLAYVLDRKDMNTATITRFQRLWTKNFIYNLPFLLQSKPVKALKNIAEGTTAIVVAGGPTLEKCLPYIKKVQEKAIIIVVDTAYKFLKANFIKPDIIVTVDPQYWNYKYLENENINDAVIIAEPFVYHKIFHLAPINNFFSGASIFPIAEYFDYDSSRGTLAAGGSVATTAFDAARIIGSKQIILAGLDLSFPGRMTHFKGAYFEKNFLNISDYFNTAEHASYNYLVHSPLQDTEATDKSRVFSDQKMFLFKKWFDREIPLTNAVVVEPVLGQALFDGVKLVPLENLPVDIEINLKFEFTKIIKEHLRSYNKINWDYLKGKINEFLKEAEEIGKTCKKITGLILKDGNIDSDNLKKVEELEKLLFISKKRSNIAKIISSSAQDILLSIVENIEYNIDLKKSGWIKTRLLHESIASLAVFYKNCFLKLLKLF